MRRSAFQARKGKGCRLATVARFNGSEAEVRMVEVPVDRPAARIRGTENVLEIRSTRYTTHPILIQGPGAGPKVTAAGLMTDLVFAAERVTHHLAETGLPILIHPYNQSLFEQLSEDAFAAGKPRNWRTFAEVYTTDAIWHTAVNTLLNLQRLSGVRLHLVHTHSAGSLRLIRRAKEEGSRVSCAVDPKYYHLRREDLKSRAMRPVNMTAAAAADDELCAVPVLGRVAAGQPILAYAPSSTGASAYRRLAKEVMERVSSSQFARSG
mgnify:CR=1 FL=1